MKTTRHLLTDLTATELASLLAALTLGTENTRLLANKAFNDCNDSERLAFEAEVLKLEAAQQLLLEASTRTGREG